MKEPNLESPDYWLDEDGNCDHHWVGIGTAKDGTGFARCTRCGEECEV